MTLVPVSQGLDSWEGAHLPISNAVSGRVRSVDQSKSVCPGLG